MVRVEVRTMINISGFGRRGYLSLKPAACAILTLVTLSAAGCSADVTRFDSASFNLDDPQSAEGPPVPPEPVHTGSLSSAASAGVSRTQPRGPYGAGAGSVEMAALPEPSAPPSSSAPSSYSARPFRSHDAAEAPSPMRPVADAGASRGQMIEVQRGDTLYRLSRQHNVSVSELMSANNLSSPNIRPGQKLYLPDQSEAPPVAAVRKPDRVSAPAFAEAKPARADVSGRYGGTYTVKPGDSLYSIARANKVKFSELQQVNGITDPRTLRPGAVLRVPGVAPVSAAETIAQQTPPAAEMAPEQPTMRQTTSTQPTVINRPKQVAALTDTASDAAPDRPAPSASAPAPQERVAAVAPQAPATAPDSVKLRWPAIGKVIASFGGRPDGTHNDGINLSVPLGTEVHSAESGVVAYAGNELKGYGNLILIRHDNGWVTAYAHNDELLVKRGDKINRGQVIAKAGKTGSVDQPQVHFELRQGSKPVDPTPYMERL